MEKNRPVRSRRSLILGFVKTLFLFYAGIQVVLVLWFVLGYVDLNLLTISKGKVNYSRTKILFDYPDHLAIVWDEHNKLYKIYGGSPSSIDVRDSTRLVVFTEPVILKSNADSVEIGHDYARYKGYLGIWTDTRKFLVDARGEVREIRNGDFEPKF